MADDTVETARDALKAFIKEHEQWIAALPIQHAGSPRLWTNMESLVDALIAAVRAENAPTQPPGSFGYCPVCYHPLDGCTNCAIQSLG